MNIAKFLRTPILKTYLRTAASAYSYFSKSPNLKMMTLTVPDNQFLESEGLSFVTWLLDNLREALAEIKPAISKSCGPMAITSAVAAKLVSSMDSFYLIPVVQV